MGPELIILTAGAVQWVATLPMLRRLSAPPAGAGGRGMIREVSVVIPARDEAGNLPLLLESLGLQDRQPYEVIVVDDDSTDNTAAIASAAGARVISPGPLPDSWRGKPWACARGAEEATGKLLLFLDADCRFAPGGLDEILARYMGGAFAVCPYHAVEKPHEQFSAMFNLIMVASTIPAGLVGQCLLIDRETYQQAGGYASVKTEILENVKFAEKIRASGGRTASIPGRGILNFRMYPGGMAELINGWTKGFAAGAAATPGKILFEISAWIGGLVTGIIAPCVTPWGWLLYLAFALQMVVMLRRVGSFSPLCGLLYPVVLIFYLVVFLRALGPAGRRATWKGRELHAA